MPTSPGLVRAEPRQASRLPSVRDRRGGTPEAMEQLLKRIARGEKDRRSHRERRATPRVAVGLDVEVTCDGVTVLRHTHDLSTFGLSIRTGPALRGGATVTLRLFLPDSPASPLVLAAVVVRPFDANGGVRVRFIDPPIEAVRRIHRLVRP